MARIVPFDEKEKCDDCGKVGAYDFMGDLLCTECADKAINGGEMSIPPDGIIAKSKQEEIREGLGNLQLFKWDAESYYLTNSNIERILQYLHSQGVVIKSGYDQNFNEIIEPLIEVKNEK